MEMCFKESLHENRCFRCAFFGHFSTPHRKWMSSCGAINNNPQVPDSKVGPSGLSSLGLNRFPSQEIDTTDSSSKHMAEGPGIRNLLS